VNPDHSHLDSLLRLHIFHLYKHMQNVIIVLHVEWSYYCNYWFVEYLMMHLVQKLCNMIQSEAVMASFMYSMDWRI
jgi:hypothetical protein